MRTLLPLTILLAVVLGGCEKPAPLAIDHAFSDNALSATVIAGAVARPFRGRCQTTFNPPPLPLPPVHQQIDTGTCLLTHLGRASIHGQQEIDFAAGTQSGSRTITAANGDVLLVKNVGTSQPAGPGLVRFSAIMTFVGGTGRFADASGEARAEGTANLITRTTAIDIMEGWIAYDASTRD